MKASDLRVGNIVQHPNRGKDGYTYINSRDLQNIEEGTEFGKLFQLIPLTPEWLERLGFQQVNGNQWYKDEGDYPNQNTVALYNATVGYRIEHQMRCITHVHELQNLYYALTGTELKPGKQ